MLFLMLLHKIPLNCKVGDYKIGHFGIITCSSLYECQAFAGLRFTNEKRGAAAPPRH